MGTGDWKGTEGQRDRDRGRGTEGQRDRGAEENSTSTHSPLPITSF